MDTYIVVLTFTQPLLGAVPLSKDFYRRFISRQSTSQEDAEQEVATVGEAAESGVTGFHRVEGCPILYDYAIKGFFKDACGMLARVEGSLSSRLRAHRKVIDGLLFVQPRRIPITVAGEISVLERPLRGRTPQGERVAIARSEMIPAGSRLGFTVRVLDVISEALLQEWLDYGRLRGLGQFRNGGYGTFTFVMQRA